MWGDGILARWETFRKPTRIRPCSSSDSAQERKLERSGTGNDASAQAPPSPLFVMEWQTRNLLPLCFQKSSHCTIVFERFRKRATSYREHLGSLSIYRRTKCCDEVMSGISFYPYAGTWWSGAADRVLTFDLLPHLTPGGSAPQSLSLQ